jgi:hypothetical protein
MDKLPTELDSRIASFLVGKTKVLSAFSKVNKYYRMLAEPYLYKTITIKEGDRYTLFWLLFTLLERKELALSITSFLLVPGSGSGSSATKKEKEEQLESGLRVHRDSLHQRILEVVSPHFLTFLRWRLELLEDPSVRGNHFLALILCMAKKIERISFWECVDGSCRSTRALLAMPPCVEDDAPFKHLKYLSFGGLEILLSITPILPSLETLEIEDCYLRPRRFVPLFRYPLPMPPQPVLRRLVFQNTHYINTRVI